MKLCIDELCINEIMFLLWFISISLLLKLMLLSQMIQRCDLFLSCAQWARAVKSYASDLIDFLPFELRKIEFSLKPLLNSQKIFHYSLGPAERSLMFADETFLLLFICFCCMLRKLKTQFLSHDFQSVCLKIVRRKLDQNLSVALKLTDMLGFCLLNNQLRFLSQITSHDF